MKKSDAYIKLFKLQENGQNISSYIEMLAKSDNVPFEVLNFLEGVGSVDTSYLSDLKTKKFYKTIMESDNVFEQAKGLSSFVTHTLIEISNNPDSRKIISESIDIKQINDSLSNFVRSGNSSYIVESVDYVKTILKGCDAQWR